MVRAPNKVPILALTSTACGSCGLLDTAHRWTIDLFSLKGDFATGYAREQFNPWATGPYLPTGAHFAPFWALLCSIFFSRKLNMADNYNDMTGVLMLDKVTPVIEALFGHLHLQKNFPGDGRNYIAIIAAQTSTMWRLPIDELYDLAENWGLVLETGPDEPEEVLEALVTHFGASKNEDVAALFARVDYEDEADLEDLFLLAQVFDDGHGLKGIDTEGSWTSNRHRLGHFGGYGMHLTKNVRVTCCSSQANRLGTELDQALESNNLEDAAKALAKDIGTVLASINDEKKRHAIRLFLAGLLTQDNLAGEGKGDRQ